MDSIAEQLSVVDYSRQAELDAVLTQRMDKNNIQVIVGCGGIGFWLGLQLAMLGYRNFVLIDGQNVDYSNLNRLPVPQTWVGRNKAVALRKIIRSMRHDTVVVPITTHICKDTFSIFTNIQRRFRALGSNYYSDSMVTVWDTTDNARVQSEIHDYIKALNDSDVTYRKLGYEGFNVGCYKDYSVWTADDYQTGYRTSNANAVTSAISAGLGIFARCMTEEDVELDLRKLLTEKKGSVKLNEYKQECKALNKTLEAILNYLKDDGIMEDGEGFVEHMLENLTERGLI